MKKRGLKLGGDYSSLSAEQKEILDMLTIEYETPKRVALRRGTSIQAVYKTINKLKRKGIDLKKNRGKEISDRTFKPQNHQIRLHGEQYLIKIIWKDNKYKEILKRANHIEIDGNYVKLWQDSIEVYSNQSFYGKDVNESFVASNIYWNRYFRVLENEVKCILVKPRNQNIKLVKCHFAETNNELSIEVDNQGDRFFKIPTDDDGKIWCLVDNSFNLHELETIHPKTAKQDMEKVKAVFNDIRDKPIDLLSTTKNRIDNIEQNIYKAISLIEQQAEESTKQAQFSTKLFSIMEENTNAVKFMAENQRSHAAAIQQLYKLAKNINNKLSQKKLGDFI